MFLWRACGHRNSGQPRKFGPSRLGYGVTSSLLRIAPPGIEPGLRSPEDEWEPLDRYYTEFEHPLWKSERVQHATSGHGGMDFLEDWRLIECLRRSLPTDQNVYDAAAWSSIVELTERSVRCWRKGWQRRRTGEGRLPCSRCHCPSDRSVATVRTESSRRSSSREASVRLS